MRNAMPVRWIEQAEAREVLAAALFEETPTPASVRHRAADGRQMAYPGARVACSRMPDRLPDADAAAHAGPPAGYRGERRRGDDEGYARRR